jgi:hypothetical protein
MTYIPEPTTFHHITKYREWLLAGQEYYGAKAQERVRNAVVFGQPPDRQA